jgi:hypothetical protein
MLGLKRAMSRQSWRVGVLLILISSSPALAEKRIALVIGNSAYIKAASLPNPKNDALAMADLLRRASFDVVDVKTDLGVDGMRRALRDFSEQVRDADMALVFYAGHGMEMNGVNYLIPVDATLARDVDVEDEAVPLDRVIRTIERVRRLQLVILDACRDNPFVRTMRRTFVSRSLRSGHGDIDERALPPNTLIAYAQKAGLTAEDGEGANSPYTAALLKHPTPGLDVELALRRVRDEVLNATRNRQEPFKYGSLGGAELPLVPAAAFPGLSPPPTPTPQYPWSAAEREWQQFAKDTKDIRLLEAFKEKHKDDPVYLRLAEARIEELKKQQVANATSQKSDIAGGIAPPPIIGTWTWKSKCEDGLEEKGEYSFEQQPNGRITGACRSSNIDCSSLSGQVNGNQIVLKVYHHGFGINAHHPMI